MELKIGDSISYLTFSGHMGAACVVSIEATPPGEKYGHSVPVVNLKEQPCGTICLSDGHWCYFNQVQRVLNKNLDSND